MGIGFDEVGVQAFVNGRYFENELYLDKEKKSYNHLGYKRGKILSTLWNLVSKETKAAAAKVHIHNFHFIFFFCKH